MAEDSASREQFQALMGQLRSDDESVVNRAADVIYARHIEAVQTIVRLRLTSPSLRRIFDSQDVCQSTFRELFNQHKHHQLEISSDDHLKRLLAQIARYRLRDYVRRYTAQIRNVGRLDEGALDDGALLGSEETPSRVAVFQEWLEMANELLSPQERELADLRAGGHTWDEIAALLNESAETLKKRLNRAIDRVCRELGFYDD